MQSIGQTLKAARTARGLTASQAAQAIRAKVQFVEALEADNFQRLGAPIYIRGFLKLYAEFLELDPAPLLRELGATHAAETAAPAPPAREARKGRVELEGLLSRLRFPQVAWRKVGWALGILVLLLILVFSIKAARRRARTAPPVQSAPAAAPSSEPATKREPLPMLEVETTPYLDDFPAARQAP